MMIKVSKLPLPQDGDELVEMNVTNSNPFVPEAGADANEVYHPTLIFFIENQD
ncbi:MAG: hypothetical protein ACJAT4_003127 [Granulosicoccus sp.]|jgi:hypothetical protein